MAKAKPRPATRSKPSKIGAFEMLRDVLVAGINKGQVPQVTLALVCIVIVLKMPPADVTAIVTRLFDGLRDGYYLGWFAVPILLIGWGWHSKSLRSRFTKEMQRVTTERSKVQQAGLNERIKSSNV